jgi:AraC-like DNA-binding protein
MKMPCSQLNSYIAKYWLWQFPESLSIPEIFPGTGMELLFNLGPPVPTSQPTTGTIGTGQAVLICPRTLSFRASTSGKNKLVSVRFRSSGFFRLFAIPMIELSDRITDAHSLIPDDLIPRLFDAKCDNEIVSILENWLLTRINIGLVSRDGISRTIDDIYYQRHQGGIRDVHQSLNMSERTFQRKFKLYTGVSAKYFDRTARFQSTLKTILSNPTIPYIRTALDNGYYDQPYFINEFKFFTHQSPKQYLSHDLSHSDLNLIYYTQTTSSKTDI